MNKLKVIILLAILLTFSCIGSYGSMAYTTQAKISPQLQLANDEPVEVLIHLKKQPIIRPSYSDKEVVATLQQTAKNSQDSLLNYLDLHKQSGKVQAVENFYVVNMIYAEVTPALVEKIAERTDVKYIYPNSTYEIDLPDPGEMIGVLSIDVLWNIEHVNAPEVWDQNGVDGSGVVIGIIDSGVDWEHPALKNNWRGYDGVSPDPDFNWYDPIYNSILPDDHYNHGTHVIGTALGFDRNENLIIGVAPEAKWIAARGLDHDGTASAFYLIKAGQFMLAPTDSSGKANPDMAPDIILNSWGSSNIDDDWYLEMVQNWLSASILPVFAAGNSGPSEGTILNPANYPEVIAAGSINNNNRLSNFSSRGPGLKGEEIKPDLVAPGENIISSVSGGGYASKSGTSMAAPHLAGVAALLLSAEPLLNANDLANILKQSTTPLTNEIYPKSPNYGFGYGLVNAWNAVEFLQTGDGGTITGNIIIKPKASVNVAFNIEILGNVVLMCESSSYKGPMPKGEIIKSY